MASITIRNLEVDLKRRLRIRAAEHGRSMEEEAREILRHVLTEPVTPRSSILVRQISRAASVRSMAAWPSRPVWVKPSPRRTMREKASMIRKPSRAGRAMRRRQLLVPRSSAA